MRNQMINKEEEYCNTGLSLGIRSHEDYLYNMNKIPPVQFHILFPSKPEEYQEEEKEKPTKRANSTEEEEEYIVVKDRGGSGRKKLKLTKEQAAWLEESFREQHTLNLTQKKLLAERLKLSSRQVEVWFQNRRARDKMKQTEVKCEMLRKWCESLSDENRRLKRELQLMTAAMLTICRPSCEQN